LPSFSERGPETSLILEKFTMGRPTQQLNVTSLSVQFTSEEIARARAVVRELSLRAPILEAEPATAPVPNVALADFD
jgi:hypothetical protein